MLCNICRYTYRNLANAFLPNCPAAAADYKFDTQPTSAILQVARVVLDWKDFASCVPRPICQTSLLPTRRKSITHRKVINAQPQKSDIWISQGYVFDLPLCLRIKRKPLPSPENHDLSRNWKGVGGFRFQRPKIENRRINRSGCASRKHYLYAKNHKLCSAN